MEATPAALGYLAEVIERMHGLMGDQYGFRITPTAEDELALAPSAPRPEDAVLQHGDRAVLIIGSDVASLVENRTLDLEIGGDGTRNLLLIESGPGGRA